MSIRSTNRSESLFSGASAAQGRHRGEFLETAFDLVYKSDADYFPESIACG